MDQQLLAEIITLAMGVLRPRMSASNEKLTYAYFAPSPEYADSWVRTQRKGGGFMGMSAPAPDSPVEYLDIAITFKPGIIGPEWVGYTMQIQNPETQPMLTAIFEWPQGGGQNSAGPDKLGLIRDHLAKLVQQPIVDAEPPREAPETMF